MAVLGVLSYSLEQRDHILLIATLVVVVWPLDGTAAVGRRNGVSVTGGRGQGQAQHVGSLLPKLLLTGTHRSIGQHKGDVSMGQGSAPFCGRAPFVCREHCGFGLSTVGLIDVWSLIKAMPRYLYSCLVLE